MIEDQPWVAVDAVCHMYGVTYGTAKNKIASGTFAVPTYKMGNKWVIDREVHERFFQEKRAAALSQYSRLSDCEL